MATPGRHQDPGLTTRLFTEPQRFEFYQAVRLLERLAAVESSASDAPHEPLGVDGRPGQEPVRFRSTASLAYPASDVVGLERELDSLEPLMTVAFMGMTGPLGALPNHYSDRVLHRVRSRDRALRDFLDLFNHRAISFLYCSWAKYRTPIAYERARSRPDGMDVFTRALLACVGRGTPGMQNRLEVRDEAFVRFAGHFSRAVPSAVSLERVLADYFELPVQIEQFQGEWITLGILERTSLPRSGRRRGAHSQLGIDAMVGSRAYDVSSRFRVRIGPVPYRVFREFMPVGDLLRPMCEMIRSYVGVGLSFDVLPVLEGGETPECRIGSETPDVPRLGWNTWLGRPSPEVPFDGVTFGLESN